MSKPPYKVTPLKGRIDMFDVFQKFKYAVMTEGESFGNLLHDPYMFGEYTSFDIGNLKISYFEPNNSLMFSCNEGTLILELCADKKTGNDYIYYREPDAKQGVGKGTLVAQLAYNGTALQKTPEIHNTDIDKTQYRTQKAFSFDALLEELQTFRMCNVPKTVPVEYEQSVGIVVCDGRLSTLETIQRATDISTFCRELTDEERKIAYKNNEEGYNFRKANDPFFKKENDVYYKSKLEENEEFIIDDDEEEFIIDDDDMDMGI